MNNSTLLYGYYGMKNSGDDALLLSTAWSAKEFLGSSSLCASSYSDFNLPVLGKVTKNLTESQLFKGENRLRQYSIALNSEKLIFGGGSVLHNSHDIKLKNQLCNLSKNAPLALGVGIGPFKDKDASKHCRKFLERCEFVGVRDQKSYNLAQEIAPDANVELTFDLAPLLLLNPELKLSNPKREGICICLCPHESLSGELEKENKRILWLASTLRPLISAGLKVTLLNFNGHSVFGDNGIHQRLLNLLGPEAGLVKVIPYQSNPLKVLEALEHFELVLSMRLHGSILAYMANTPFISINYHDKCAEWCKTAGVRGEFQFDCNAEDQAALKQAIERSLEGKNQTSLSIHKAVSQSLLNWRVQDEQIHSCNIRCYSSVQ